MTTDQPANRLSIGDVLRHLVTHAPTYGEDNRVALLEAVNAEYPPPEPVQRQHGVRRRELLRATEQSVSSSVAYHGSFTGCVALPYLELFVAACGV